MIALYGTVVPKTVQNFKALVTGEKGFGYKGTSFYRIVKGLQISAGDVEGNLGRSGKSALTGGTFDQENFRLLHTMQGMVSMVNTIEKEVDSRFFISTRQEVEPAYSAIFDNKYVAFGRVVEGRQPTCDARRPLPPAWLRLLRPAASSGRVCGSAGLSLVLARLYRFRRGPAA